MKHRIVLLALLAILLTATGYLSTKGLARGEIIAVDTGRSNTGKVFPMILVETGTAESDRYWFSLIENRTVVNISRILTGSQDLAADQKVIVLYNKHAVKDMLPPIYGSHTIIVYR